MRFLSNTHKTMKEAHFLPCYRLPQAQPIPHLHDLCTTVPAAELPVDLRLASRVYHTPNRTGHKAVLGQLGSSLLGDCGIDEQRDR